MGAITFEAARGFSLLGDEVGAWMDVTNGTTDLSGNSNDLTENGTVTQGDVATGADLQGYSGFSASNYFERAYDADFDYGTGDFAYSVWFKTSSTAAAILFDRNDSGGAGPRTYLYIEATTGYLSFHIAGTTIQTTSSMADGEWHLAVGVRVSGVGYLYVDGALVASLAAAATVTNTSAHLTVGARYSHATAFTGSLSLLRTVGDGRTAAQIKSIYDKEKHLFKPYSYYTQEGESYSFDLEQMTPRPSVAENKNETRTLSNKRRSIVHSISKEWEIQTGVIHRTDGTTKLRKSEFDEIMFSTNGSESFTYDPYGTIASPVDPLTVQRISQGYTLPPIDNTELFRSSFRVAEVDE